MYKAESGEDKIVEYLLSERAHESFAVDVGAWDGMTWSNSLYFFQLGWRGICLEPSPGPFKRLSELHKSRPNVACIPLAISNFTGSGTLFFGSDGVDYSGMSTLCQEDNDWFRYARSDESITVPVDTLTNVLRDNSAPFSFGLLSIDTEGMDYEVLLGLDFNLYRPITIVTEEYDQNLEKLEAKHSLLNQNKYTLVEKTESNTIWLDKA